MPVPDIDRPVATTPATPRRRTVMTAVLGGGLLSACAAEPTPVDTAADATSADPTSADPTSAAPLDPSSADPNAVSVSPTPSTSPTSKPSAKAATSSTTKAGTTKAPTKTSSTTTSSTSKTSSTTKTSTKTSSTTKTGAPEPVDVTLAEIPVGGTVVKTIRGRAVALTRPSSGTVRAFDATCTHAGCPVLAAGSRFTCPCHGSAFSTSGAVLNGPATSSLAAVAARVHDGGVSIG